MTENLFARVITEQLAANARLWATLSSHPVLMGSGRERALADTIAQFLPRQFEALDGSIAVPGSAETLVRSPDQTDLMVVDTAQYPTLARIGAHSFVLPEAVRAVIEVKTRLTCPPKVDRALALLKPGAGEDDEENDEEEEDQGEGARKASGRRARTDLLAAIEQVGSLVQLRDSLGDVLKAVFSFEISGKTQPAGLVKWLRRILDVRKRVAALEQGGEYDDARVANLVTALSDQALPDLIVVMNPGVVAWKEMTAIELGEQPQPEAASAYVVEKLEPHQAVSLLVIAVLAKLNTDAVGGSAVGGSPAPGSPRVIKRADLSRYFGMSWPRSAPEGATRVVIE